MRRLFFLIALVVLFVLACRISVAQSAKPKLADKALVYAQYLLARIHPLPPKISDPAVPASQTVATVFAFESDFPPDQYQEAQSAFEVAIKLGSRDPRVFVGLARCQEKLGQYSASARSYEKALALQPSDSAAQVGRRRTLLLAQIARSAASQLPKGQAVVTVAPIQTDRRGQQWAVLSRSSPGSRTDTALLSLFVVHGTAVRMLGTSNPLGAPGLYGPGRWFSDLYLFVQDIDGTRAPRVCVLVTIAAGDVEPEYLEIFTLGKGVLINSFGVESNWPIWIQDINHDGRCEIGTYHEIGETMDHASQPVWMDIYAYKNGKYQLADADFPSEFRGWPVQLKQALHAHPGDPDILRHLGEAYAILGERRRALTSYDEAVVASRKAIHSETDSEIANWDKDELRDIEQERARFERTRKN